jgi:Flp pilus assembly protein TadG
VSRRRDERGSSLVEFALVIPVFMLIVIGAASIVWLLGARSAVTGAARDGARFASIRHESAACASSPCYPTAAEVKAYVEERAGMYGVDTVTVTPVQYRNQILEVRVTRRLPNVFNSFAGLFGLGDIDYSSTARARTE